MGFTEDQASIALLKAGGDVGRAVHLLLDQPEIAASSSAPPPRTESVTAGLPVPAPRFEDMYESAGMAISTPEADEGELTEATLKQMGFEATAVAAAMQQSGGDATRALERLLAVDEAEQSQTTRGPSGDACASTAHASDEQIAAGGVVQQKATARKPEMAQSAKISQRIGRARAALDKKRREKFGLPANPAFEVAPVERGAFGAFEPVRAELAASEAEPPPPPPPYEATSSASPPPQYDTDEEGAPNMPSSSSPHCDLAAPAPTKSLLPNMPKMFMPGTPRAVTNSGYAAFDDDNDEAGAAPPPPPPPPPQHDDLEQQMRSLDVAHAPPEASFIQGR
jgi:hypothetical protein